jgi:hypothetical protein
MAALVHPPCSTSVEQGALCLHLGDNDKHTVFKGEGVVGCLAIALLLRLPNVQGAVTIVWTASWQSGHTRASSQSIPLDLRHLAQAGTCFRAAEPAGAHCCALGIWACWHHWK